MAFCQQGTPQKGMGEVVEAAYQTSITGKSIISTNFLLKIPYLHKETQRALQISVVRETNANCRCFLGHEEVMVTLECIYPLEYNTICFLEHRHGLELPTPQRQTVKAQEHAMKCYVAFHVHLSMMTAWGSGV